MAATPTPLVTRQTSQLIGYGLLLGAAAVGGKLVIDALVDDMDAAKDKKGFIGPIYEKPYYKSQRSKHETASEVVKVVAMAASIYSLLAELPALIKQWGQVQATVRQITQ